MSALTQPGPDDPAPEHIWRMIAAVAPCPLETPPEAWGKQIQRIADRIWSEASHAGATWWAGREVPPRMLVVTEEERARLLESLPHADPPCTAAQSV